MEHSELINALNLEVEGLQFMVDGLEAITENSPCDVTVEWQRKQIMRFCWLAGRQIEEMKGTIQGE